MVNVSGHHEIFGLDCLLEFAYYNNVLLYFMFRVALVPPIDKDQYFLVQ